ncbi:MAG: endonuclease/exonuclease/phosphatase [Marinilabiliales bacterium]|nr:MAG: endonuclease/exonuclease/phosphatase [Marinilabiliales bacterium]
MKLIKFVIILIASAIVLTLSGQTSIMTFNIRYNNTYDGENSWENRKVELTQMLISYHPDILGIQEGLFEQNEYISQQLNNYKYVGVAREDGKQKGEYTPIFYNTKTYELLETKTYWLSQTPDKVSVGWNASMERITTYGVFKNKITNDTLYVFNCHYDHIGKKARKKSSKLIIKLIKEKGILNKHLIVMGDLNSMPEDAAIRILKNKLTDSFEVSNYPKEESKQTYNDFDNQYFSNKRIDYIFTRNLDVISHKIIYDRRNNGLFISDHFPVLIQTLNN